MTQDCKRQIRKKKRRYKRARQTKNPSDWSQYQQAASKSKKTCKDAYNTYVRESVSPNIKQNPKRFFSFIKSKKCDNVGVSPLRDQGTTFIDAPNKARILLQQFSNVFSKDDGSNPTMKSQPAPAIAEIQINKLGVTKLIQQLKPFKASGPDRVTARFLKETCHEIADGLTLIFQASIHQSAIPNDWRDALIAPIYKGGKKDRGKAENYRPVSLTSVACKLLEHIVYSHIAKHFDTNNILTDAQHGFRKKRSCETQLISTVHDLAKGLNESQQIDAILLDFSKAFDKVCHRKLCLKLDHYGVRGKTLNWIRDFLTNRTHSVVVAGTVSSTAHVESGVPQGTVLGPLLFLAYINDLPERVNFSSTGLFADDALIYKIINSNQDSTLLQEDLNSLTEWEKEWSMEFHPDKCKLLRITNKRKPISAQYFMHNIQLKSVDQEKYLGVILHKKLSWKPHIGAITSKANSTRQFLQRNLRTCSKDVKLQCYTTFVRPIVEYASTVWDPNGNKGLVEQVESVQRKAARFICADWRRKSSPTHMIEELKLQSLEYRRYLAKIKLMHAFVHGHKFISDDKLPERTRYDSNKFQPIYGRVQSFTSSYIPSTVSAWNKLPSNVIKISCPDLFNSNYDC